MTEPNTDQQLLPGLTPGDIRHATLPYAKHGGYDAPAVQQVLAAAADQLAAAQAEIIKLQAEVARAAQGTTMDVSAETVNLLSRAQVIADKHVSDAEQYAHDLIDSARNQYAEMLQKAQDSVAAQPAGAAPAATGSTDAGTPAYATPIEDIEYVRTYTKVAQVQLRAVIDALAEQVDKLGTLPRLGHTPPEPPQVGQTQPKED